MYTWNKYFPFSEPREAQTNVINKVLSSFKDGKRFAIVDCGTGVGKSAIGLTIARAIVNDSEYEGKYENGAYFLTTQKVLQEQYEKDFSKSSGLVSLYSSSNYMCSVDKNTSCKDVQTGLRTKSLPKKFDCCGYKCKYKEKKKDFIDKQVGITNFSYFLTEKNYSQKVPNKKVLIIDEAHNLENELTKFIEVSVSSFFSEKILKKKIPKDLNTQFKVFNWIKEEYFPAIDKKYKFVQSQLEKFGITTSKAEEFQKITKNFEMLSSHRSKIEQFISIYDKDNWVFDKDDTQNGYFKLAFKPIDVAKYAQDYILQYADYVIFMSATIISHEGFSLTLGLPHDKVISIKEPSPFPPKNRPIIYTPAGSMSFKNIDNTLPTMVKMVESIIEHHNNDKGIIHTHGGKIADYIKRNIAPKYRKRILVAYGDTREKALKKHISSKQPTILVSPSMAEGVDLKGDLSKFQVICKMPFPYLGSKVVKKKMAKWDWWYNTQTVRTIIQSIGRSIRSENDVAVTYILDKDWERLKNKIKHLLPKDFFDSYNEY